MQTALSPRPERKLSRQRNPQHPSLGRLTGGRTSPGRRELPHRRWGGRASRRRPGRSENDAGGRRPCTALAPGGSLSVLSAFGLLVQGRVHLNFIWVAKPFSKVILFSMICRFSPLQCSCFLLNVVCYFACFEHFKDFLKAFSSKYIHLNELNILERLKCS